MSCSRGGIHPGLERLQAALAALGHPERQFAAVQVAGTNGKGSISSLVHSALQAAGIRCGLSTSPHLVSWTERIQLGDKAIASIELQRLLERIEPIARQFELSPFELITAAAFCAFAAAGVELAVLEVGMGGRLDATSCHPQRRVIGFATVGLDHQEWLGSSLAAIAAEKAAVLQPDALACSAPQHPEVAAVLNQRASAVGAQLRWLEPLDLNTWSLGLPGQVQARNGAVALGMLQALAAQGWPLDGAAIRQGFTAAFAGPGVTSAQKALADALLAAIGEVAWVDQEDHINPVTAVSGGGPAYVFLLAEVLEAAAVEQGLPRDLARRMARATVAGSGALLGASEQDAADLRRAVTSPKGTTERALAVLMEPDAWPKAMSRAIQAATDRARELAG